MKGVIDNMTHRGRVYIRTMVLPSVQVPSTGISSTSTEIRQSTPALERLPLPVFEGNDMDYLQFKKDFQIHVNYGSEHEKVHALKIKCLKKAEDKRKITNLDTLK